MASGTVKFFSATKGFGFIAPEDGGPDVFVHISALERAGLRELNEGDQVSFEIEEDRRSGKVAATDLRLTGAGPAPARRPAERPRGDYERPRGDYQRAPAARGPAARQVEGSGRGVVKWFNASKGFGFIQPESGGEDVFVHISAVERAGLRELREGQTVTYDVERDGRSGKTAAANLRVDS